MNTTIKLTTAIQAHGGELTELELAEPRGKTIRECGMPFKIEMTPFGSTIAFDAASVSRYISQLANIPSSSVDQLSAVDFTTIQSVIVSFFGDVVPSTVGTDSGN